MKALKTADEVIDAVGGTAAAAALTGRKSQHVSNWRSLGRLPATTYLIFSRELSRMKKSASPELWGIEMPEDAA